MEERECLLVNNYDDSNNIGSVAIIGMSGRFPGAKDMDEFWHNLSSGVESVKFFSRDELFKMGIDEHLLDNPRFVAADAILDGMDEFDASFFDYSAREAEIMDPQHRLFLESAWEVMESAGYNSELYDGRVAVYAGANLSGYMIRNLYSNPGLVENVGTFKIMLANGQDFLATKVSYKMNFLGPSVNVNTLCSSSLVAVHQACQNLLNYGCDIALAGGVSFQVSRNEAFFYQEGGIGSSDGHCRAFDSRANGTVSGSGLAIVVLKRLEDAIADGDHIHAVIRGTGINNDGSSKNSYTAPNVDGQAECIAEAIAMSGVNPETITYIDAHGTGTDLGDPIEISALTKAFRAHTKKKQFCAIGSVKTNIGHLVNAGGLASVVKTVLAMKHKVIPPSLNFEEPNAKIDFINSPFYVNTKLSKWEAEGFPLRAGISSFGIGGTNTHVILEEAPAIEPSQPSSRPYQLIVLSAKTKNALDKMTSNLSEYIRKNDNLNLADIAFTMHMGRRNFNHKRIVVSNSLENLVNKLENIKNQCEYTRFQKPKEQPLVFMFPGVESCYMNMGKELYNTETTFKRAVDEASNILESQIGIDIREKMFKIRYEISEGLIMEDEVIKSASVFIIEYALASLLMEWGLKPQYMIGEGIGEYAAACLSGVMSLKDAVSLASTRIDFLPEKVGNITFNIPKIPFMSNITGTWITDGEAQNKEYWIKQKQGIRFFEGFAGAVKDSEQILMEVGPGNSLVAKVKEIKGEDADQAIIAVMPGIEEAESEVSYLQKSLGKFWLYGGFVNWKKFYDHEMRHRIQLPTYPFERQRYWIEPGQGTSGADQPNVFIENEEDITSQIIESCYDEGTITITFKLDWKDNETGDIERKKQLKEVLLLKERLEELNKQIGIGHSEMKISAVGLKKGSSNPNNKNDIGGKLKKRPRPELEAEYLEPRNEIEKVIVQKWQDVLGYDRIGINDDFFELGGHSLIAAAIATDLSKMFQEKFDKVFSLVDLITHTTVSALTEYILSEQKKSEASKVFDLCEEDLQLDFEEGLL
jgi:acyl transferase domain-containing protein